MVYLDKDECTTEDPCDENAICNNTDGSFVCCCHSGFSGDGLICIGAYILCCVIVHLVISMVKSSRVRYIIIYIVHNFQSLVRPDLESQLVEHRSSNSNVAGSTPSRGWQSFLLARCMEIMIHLTPEHFLFAVNARQLLFRQLFFPRNK